MRSQSLSQVTEETDLQTQEATRESTGKRMPRRVRSSKKSASAFRTISEVAEILDVQQHVLRFWETKFSQIRPLKRGGGRRYYRPEDLTLLKRIHHLLYTEGYTIKGVQKLLQQKGKKAFVGESQEQETREASNESAQTVAKTEAAREKQAVVVQGLSKTQQETLRAMLSELKELRALVQKAA